MPTELARREWLARAIEHARETRLREETTGHAPAVRSGDTPPPADVGHLDPEYIRTRVRELVPLLRECYELALDEQAGLGGRLTVEFVIAGEPDVGGVIEESRILEESTLVHPTLHECVRETLYTLELDPPENGGRVTVRYPFNFSPE